MIHNLQQLIAMNTMQISFTFIIYLLDPSRHVHQCIILVIVLSVSVGGSGEAEPIETILSIDISAFLIFQLFLC